MLGRSLLTRNSYYLLTNGNFEDVGEKGKNVFVDICHLWVCV